MSIDLPISLCWAILLTLISIAAHIIVSSYVIFSNFYANLKSFYGEYKSGLIQDPIEILNSIWDQLESVEKLKQTVFTWGMDLALLAFSIDFAVFACWMLNKDRFPFFSRWNEGEVTWDTAVWITIILVHLIIFFLTVWLNYKNIAKTTSKGGQTIPLLSIFKFKRWINQYIYATISFAFGFLSLLLNFVIITNEVW